MNHEVEYSAEQLQKDIRRKRWVLRLTQNWLKIALTFLLLYTGLSLAPPVLMHAGYERAANVLYTVYSPMCHQFAFRSWFFFGEHTAYPRAAAGAGNGTFEEYAAQDPHFEGIDLSYFSDDMLLAARSFRGNEQMGYKTALCERDVFIYGMMILAGLLFARVRRWLRPAPLWLYLILGLMPIGWDGFSQMFSYPPFEYWPVRETLPLFRVLTGSLFGLMNVWLAFPYLESSTRDGMAITSKKLAAAEQHLSVMQTGEQLKLG